MRFLYIFLFSMLFSLNNSSFQIKEMANEKFVIDFKLEDYEIINEDGYVKLLVPGSGTKSLIGEPFLPSLSSFVELDKNASYTISYEIISKNEIENQKIIPLQNFDRNIKENDYVKNESIYSSQSLFPEKNLYVSERQAMRGTEFVNLEVIPFSYNAIDNHLVVIEEIEITIEKNTTPNIPISRNYPRSKVFERLTDSFLVNSSSNLRTDDYQRPSILYICGGNTSSNPFFNQLKKWREKQGYIVYVASTSEIGGSGTTAIKNYLVESMSWETPPEFVTLIGDDGGSYDIDSYTEYNSGYNGEGDHPYSQLDGSDLWPDVVLGRISVRSSNELAVVVSKIIGYEQVYDDSQNWHEKASIVGDPSTSGISCATTAENIAQVMEQYGVEDVRLKTSGGSYDSWMVNELDEGVNFFNYRGYYGVSGFNNDDVDAANNNFKLPFATVITCGTGSFRSESQCLSEKFLRAGSTGNPKGAVACIGTATTGTHTMFNNAVNMGVYYGLFANNLQTAGEALVAGKTTLYETYPSNPSDWVETFMFWNNLMGDSASLIFTDTPKNINVNHENTINPGDNFISVNVTNDTGQQVEGALVTILHENNTDLYLEGYTDLFGNVIIPFNGDLLLSDIELTVSKFNHKPYLATVALTNNYEPYANSFNVIPSGVVFAGETLSLNIPIYYDGISAIEDITGSLTSDQNINIINGNAYYGTISNGINNSTSENFSFEISDLLDNNSTINFYINLSNAEGYESITNLSYNVENFEINILSTQIINDGNDNGKLDPGETGNLFIVVENSGTLNSPNFNCSLSTNSNDLTINNGEDLVIVPTNPNTESNSTSFTELVLDSTAFNGEIKLIDISCESESGFSIDSILEINVGQQNIGDPIGPDAYGYYIYDSGDSEYSLMPTYDWIDIEDVGTPLNTINGDDGDNQDDSQNISLPFTFPFYGEEYSSITVCSNGWISFGESSLESFRNDHLPGVAGPSPMLAVFWDDLTVDQGGEVFGYYDSALNVYIVQWNNVKTYEDNSNESFQAILFDPQYYSTPTGDGEMLLQYEDFNNTSNGSYGGGTPLHGGYCSIGIEDHFGTTGLEYTFNNVYPRSAMSLSDQTALFISTRKTGTIFNMAQAELSLSSNQFDFEISEDEMLTDNLIISNIGEDESNLSYNIKTSPFIISAGSDNFGNNWIDSELDPNNNYNWIDITTEQQVPFENNDEGQFIDLDFDFKFYGESYNQLLINPNGWLGFSEDNSAWSNESIPSNNSPINAIFAFWDDLNPSNANNSCSNEGSGNVYYQNFEDKVVVWYNDIIRCGSNEDYSGVFDFQVVLFKDQRIDINYRNMEGYNSSATIGIQNDIGSDGIQISYNDQYIQNNLRVSFKPTYNWISPINDSGQIAVGEQVNYSIIIDGDNIESESETTFIIINSNSAVSTTVIPINVLLTENIVGDVNGDEVVNVLDIVLLVNLVLTGAEFDMQSDINNDGIINILDVVQLVNIVLNG